MTYSTVPLLSAPGLSRSVRDITHTGHVTVPGHLPLAAAARTMVTRRIHAVLVCDEQGEPLGWVTTRGLLHNLPRDWEGATAKDAISEPLCAVSSTATAREALDAFLAAGASHVLVRDGQQIVGVIADSDLLALLADAAPAATE